MPRLRRGFTGVEIIILIALVVGLLAGTIAVSDRAQKFLTSKKAAGPGSGCWGSWDCDGNSYCAGASGQPGQPDAKMGVCVAGDNRPRTEEQIVQEIKQQNIASEVVQKAVDTLQAIIAQKPKEEPAPVPAAQPNTSDACSFCGGLGQGACDQGPPNYCAFGCKSNYAFCKLTGSCLPAIECKDAAGNLQTDVGPASSNPVAYAEKLQQDQQARFDTLIKGAPQDRQLLCKDRGCPDCSTLDKIAACLTGDFSDENKKLVTDALAAKPISPAPQTISAAEIETINRAVNFSQQDCRYCQGPNDVNLAAAKIIEKLFPKLSTPELINAIQIIQDAQKKIATSPISINNPDQTYIQAGQISSQTAVTLKNLLGDTDAAKILISAVSGQLQSQAESINYSRAAQKLPPIQNDDKVTQLAAEYGLSADATKQLVDTGQQYAADVEKAKLAAEATAQKQAQANAALNEILLLAGDKGEKKYYDQKAEILKELDADQVKAIEDKLASIQKINAALQKVKTAKEPWQEIVNLTPDQQKIYDTAIKSDRLLNLIVTAPDSQIIGECQKAAPSQSEECTNPEFARQILINTAPADQKQFLIQVNTQILEAKKSAETNPNILDKDLTTTQPTNRCFITGCPMGYSCGLDFRCHQKEQPPATEIVAAKGDCSSPENCRSVCKDEKFYKFDKDGLLYCGTNPNILDKDLTTIINQGEIVVRNTYDAFKQTVKDDSKNVSYCFGYLKTFDSLDDENPNLINKIRGLFGTAMFYIYGKPKGTCADLVNAEQKQFEDHRGEGLYGITATPTQTATIPPSSTQQPTSTLIPSFEDQFKHEPLSSQLIQLAESIENNPNLIQGTRIGIQVIEQMEYSNLVVNVQTGPMGNKQIIYNLPPEIEDNQYIWRNLGMDLTNRYGKKMPDGVLAIVTQLPDNIIAKAGPALWMNYNPVSRGRYGYDAGVAYNTWGYPEQMVAEIYIQNNKPIANKPRTPWRPTDRIGEWTGDELQTDAIKNGSAYLYIAPDGKWRLLEYQAGVPIPAEGDMVNLIWNFNPPDPNNGGNRTFGPGGTLADQQFNIWNIENRLVPIPIDEPVRNDVGPSVIFRTNTLTGQSDIISVAPLIYIWNNSLFRNIILNTPFPDGSIPSPNDIIVAAGDLHYIANGETGPILGVGDTKVISTTETAPIDFNKIQGNGEANETAVYFGIPTP